MKAWSTAGEKMRGCGNGGVVSDVCEGDSDTVAVWYVDGDVVAEATCAKERCPAYAVP